MTISEKKVYPRTGDYQTVYLKNVVTDSSITIGDGTIVGARAVVTKDVAPYTIVGGIPAKPIRKRFSEEVISSLLEIKWWEWSQERIRENILSNKIAVVGIVN